MALVAATIGALLALCTPFPASGFTALEPNHSPRSGAYFYQVTAVKHEPDKPPDETTTLYLQDDEFVVFVQPCDGTSPSSASDIYGQHHATVLATEAIAHALKPPDEHADPPRVPSGPKPASARPKKAYKPVAKKVKPTSERLPEDYRVVRNRPADCMDGLLDLPVAPPVWTPTTTHLTAERMAGFKLDDGGFLQPEEVKLFQHIIEHYQGAFAWQESERRRFKSEYFPPIRYPVVPHEPWADKNRPIPPGIRDQLIALLKEKIAAGVYEPSSSSYRSGWFCVVKKDGKSIRIVHDLQKLNSVTIRDAGTLPTPDEFSESCAGRTCIGALDQFSSFDLQLVHPESRDYTTFQTPIGPHRIVSLPMGWTNSVAVQHGNLVFLLAPEMPDGVAAFIDDVHPLGPRTYYNDANGKPECIPENPGIRRFIWEYAHTLTRVIHRLDHAGASISGKKAHICVSNAVVTGYHVAYEGRMPLQYNAQRIIDWPACETVSDVRAFLGVAGLCRMWIKDYALIARPLTNLIKKDIDWDFSDDCHAAMIALKKAISHPRCLRPIDYKSGKPVTLAVDSSIRGVGYVMFQDGDGKIRYPARYGSIAWNERESNYSQPKIELFSVYRALRACRFWIFGLEFIILETDASYIKGMLNNPDMQPNATINRWIAGILLFNIRLHHVPAEKHGAADGLSRRQPSPNDPVEPDDHEEWLDTTLGLWLAADWQLAPHSLPSSESTGALIQYPDIFAVTDLVAIPRAGPLQGTVASYFNTSVLERLTPANAVPPRTDGQKRRDAELYDIRDFLTNLQMPDIEQKRIQQFVTKAQRFFVINGRLFRRDPQGKNKVVLMTPQKRIQVIIAAHDDLGHKGPWPTTAQLRERFWWPGLEADVRWYCKTCVSCQQRATLKVHIPPTIALIATLFQKVYMDTMHLPASNKYKYVVQARCSLTTYPEWRKLVKQTAEAIARFILEEILCRWGYVSEIVTDNGTPFIAALDWLAEHFGIRHIKISGYNSQANGAVESKHYSVRESLVKLCGGNISKWSQVIHLIFWAERTTIRRATGLSPYYMVHGVEPVMPFDLAKATFLVNPKQARMSTEELIALRAQQLEKREDDLAAIKELVYESRYQDYKEFLTRHGHSIRDYNFKPGALVLVRNTRIEKDLGLKKVEPRYYGPMLVVQRNTGGNYVLAELDGSVSSLRCAAFRLIPFLPRSEEVLDVSDILEEAREQLRLIQNASN